MAAYDVVEMAPPDPNSSTQAEAVNQHGLAAGVEFETLTFEGTSWLSGGPPQVMAQSASTAYDANDNGDLVGAFGMDNTPTQHAFVIRGGFLTDLGAVVGLESLATGVNNKGLVVGWVGVAPQRGFIFDSVTQGPPIFIPPAARQVIQRRCCHQADGNSGRN
jgi:uncharacterized membrane protein